VRRLMVLGVISALLLCFEKLSAGRKVPAVASPAPRIITLHEVLRHHEALPATARAFYEALLAQGEVLAVQVEYLPDPLLWLTTTSEQARWMREQHNASAGLESVVMSAADARELLSAMGTEVPSTLQEIAQVLVSQAPAEV
jgi:hypothetical protein